MDCFNFGSDGVTYSVSQPHFTLYCEDFVYNVNLKVVYKLLDEQVVFKVGYLYCVID